MQPLGVGYENDPTQSGVCVVFPHMRACVVCIEQAPPPPPPSSPHASLLPAPGRLLSRLPQASFIRGVGVF